ncbi:MAG: Jag N-terminal domain-containing protein [Oscillospiraceae bacterium]|nr:Jag N-terminal domain-containing protein [Oscillospiraceae bacterium]
MIKEAFASGETMALAKMKACEILGVHENDAEFEVVQMPSPRMFGIFGGQLAQVRAKIKPSFSHVIKECLSDLLYYMGMKDFEVEIEEECSNVCYAKINGGEINYILGKHGKTLDAVQYVIGLLVNNSSSSVENKSFCKIRLNAGDYRERRKKTLVMLGKKLAYKVLNTHKDIKLEPMRSYERKVIHDTIQGMEGVYSWSEGLNEDRHVIISENKNNKEV